MTDSHAQLEAWLVDGATGDPPREIAVHATLCDSCAARLGAFDALALIDVAAAGSPPPLAAPTRLRQGVAGARLATAVVGTVVAGILVVFGVSQLVGLGGPAGGPAGGPEGTELAGLSNTSDGAGPAQSQDVSSIGPDAVVTPTPGISATPQPGVTPGPLPSFPPVATPRPPTPQPPATAAPTPPPTPTPTPTPTPDPTPMPTPIPPTVPGIPVLSASPGAGAGVVDLIWTEPADGGSPIDHYEIERFDGSATTIIPTVGPVTSFQDSGLTSGVEHTYRVRAMNLVGAGEWSAPVLVRPN